MQLVTLSPDNALKHDILSLWHFITTSPVQLADAGALAALGINVASNWPSLVTTAADGTVTDFATSQAWLNAVRPLLPAGYSAADLETASDQIWILNVTSEKYFSSANFPDLVQSTSVVTGNGGLTSAGIAAVTNLTTPVSFDRTRAAFGALQNQIVVPGWAGDPRCHPAGIELTSLFPLSSPRILRTA
jgi:hypothetical protein